MRSDNVLTCGTILIVGRTRSECQRGGHSGRAIYLSKFNSQRSKLNNLSLESCLTFYKQLNVVVITIERKIYYIICATDKVLSAKEISSYFFCGYVTAILHLLLFVCKMG